MISRQKVEKIVRKRVLILSFAVLTLISSIFIIIIYHNKDNVPEVIWFIFWFGVAGVIASLSAWLISRFDPLLDSPDPTYISGVVSEDEIKVLLLVLNKDKAKRAIIFLLATVIYTIICWATWYISDLARLGLGTKVLLITPIFLLEVIYIWAFIIRPISLYRRIQAGKNKRALIRLKISGRLTVKRSPVKYIDKFLPLTRPYFYVDQHKFRTMRLNHVLDNPITNLDGRQVEVEIATILPDIPLRIKYNGETVYDQTTQS